MKKELNLVRGAVATKDLIPVLTHFHIYDGFIQGGNGRIAINTACQELKGINVTVPADRFLKAVDACDEQPIIKVNKESGKLRLSKGKFKAILPLAEHASFPLQAPEGKKMRPKDELLPMLSALRTFIGDDASRPWACGILIKNGYAYATNNIVLARYKINWNIKQQLTIPTFSVDELLRIDVEPKGLQVTDKSITFHLNNAWIKASLLSGEWPDIDKFFSVHKYKRKLDTQALIDAVEKVRPFCPDPKFPVITLGKDGVSTAEGDMSATVAGLKLPDAKFRAEPLQDVLRIADNIDLSQYPKPCPFIGENIEGVVIGINT